jgi:Zn-dependent M28 family amino/carboxypeptidase
MKTRTPRRVVLSVGLGLLLAACGQPRQVTPAADPDAGGAGLPWSSVAPADSLSSLALTPGENTLSYEPFLSAANGWGPVERDRSNGEQAAGDGRTLTLNGQTYSRGFGTHAGSDLRFSLKGSGVTCTRFTAEIGVDDEVGSRGSVVFQVYLDGAKVHDSGRMTGSSATRKVSLDVAGKAELRLVVTDAGDGRSADHADWAAPRLACQTAPAPDPAASLRAAVTVAGIRRHLGAFQNFADSNGGNRAASTPGHAASATYVQQQLAAAGYSVTVQAFSYPVFVDRSALTQTAPLSRTFTPGPDFLAAEFTPQGRVSGRVQGVDLILPPTAAPSSTSGCEASDFAGFGRGNIALLQRGSCLLIDKARNAQAAGASAVIVFNEGQPGRTRVLPSTLDGPDSGVTIPVVFARYEVGSTLNRASVTLDVRVERQERTSLNVLADTRTGRADRTVVVGAHLDSVDAGPGINDNGSGSAVILETALQMARLGIQPANRVRFAFWGAEELGLLGSAYYVRTLSAQDRQNILLNLNFDMLASSNFARFVYDGDGSDSAAGPAGSDAIEAVFNDYFAARGLATRPTALNGRSDYGPFLEAGIPAGGLFSGAEGRKTEGEAALFGGAAGAPYDPCYHSACDTLATVSDAALDQMGDAAAHATLFFAQSTTFARSLSAQELKASSAAPDLDYWGDRVRR